MKKIIKIFMISLCIFLFSNIYNSVYAKQVLVETVSVTTVASVTGTITPDFYDPSTSSGISEDDEKIIKERTGLILGVIRNFAAVVSVIVLMIIGLKYIFGSVEEKANYKASLVPYIIGCIMAVAGTTIVSFIYNAMQ